MGTHWVRTSPVSYTHLDVYKRQTRNNTLMAYVNLEDDTASMELLCFSRVLNESGGYIRENLSLIHIFSTATPAAM